MFRQTISPHDTAINGKYNTNNVHEYDPYIYKNNKSGVILDREWFALDIPKQAQETIVKKLRENNIDYELGVVKVPHDVHEGPAMNIIYYSYIQSFDYHHWYNARLPLSPPGVKLYTLTKQEKEDLAQVSIEQINGKYEQLKDKCPDLVKWLSTMTFPVFVRLSGTSGKNEKKLKPLKSPDDVLHFLTSNKLFLQREYNMEKRTDVIVMPWNNNITTRSEFRIFRYRGSVTCVSQQHWATLFQYTTEEVKIMQDAICDANFEGYPETMTADVYVDFNNSTCHLIEANPFGAHCGAGSALFNWVEDDTYLTRTITPTTMLMPLLRYQSLSRYI